MGARLCHTGIINPTSISFGAVFPQSSVPFRTGNGVWSPADVVVPGPFEVVDQPDAGAVRTGFIVVEPGVRSHSPSFRLLRIAIPQLCAGKEVAEEDGECDHRPSGETT